ncbi:hypothetical protein R1sor_015026 [Riccia sorocarpa]|uniref:Aminotransferase class V domain-containing protein n=1 Tax=Riccia sorocarpa TaxID=122646 RepID=A0ABD3HDP5_9MARC
MPSADEAALEKFEQLKISSDVKEREFSHHATGVARLNHGSFGSCPASVQNAEAEWRDKWSKQPDSFMVHRMEDAILESRRAIAKVINSPTVNEVLLVDNVTTAAAMVAQDLMWGFLEGRYQQGDAVLLLNFAYVSIKTCFQRLAAQVGARLIYAKIPFPISSPSHALESFRHCLTQAREEIQERVIRIAVIDHITSSPSILLPVKDMVSLCRSHGVEQVFVDGAHAIGNVDVDVQQIDADYYTSDCHKWFFSPSQVAFFHCKSKHLDSLHHPLVSTTHGQGLAAECASVGSRDYSAQLTVPAVAEFIQRETGGLEGLRRFNHESAVAMGKFLAKEWGTACGSPAEMATSMVMVGLPPVLNVRSFDEGLQLNARLRKEFQVEVPLHHVPEEDQDAADEVTKIPAITAYARISHQIYNNREDYLQLRDAIQYIVRERDKLHIHAYLCGRDAELVGLSLMEGRQTEATDEKNETVSTLFSLETLLVTAAAIVGFQITPLIQSQVKASCLRKVLTIPVRNG